MRFFKNIGKKEKVKIGDTQEVSGEWRMQRVI